VPMYQPLTGNFSALRPFGVSWVTLRGGIIPGVRAPVKAVTVCAIYGDGERPLAMGFAYCSASDKFDQAEAEDRSFKQAVSGPHGDPAVLRRIGRVFTKIERHALREAVWKLRNPQGWKKDAVDVSTADRDHPASSPGPVETLVLQRMKDAGAYPNRYDHPTPKETEKLNVREEDQGF